MCGRDTVRASRLIALLLLVGTSACERDAAPPASAVTQSVPPHGVFVELAAPAARPPAGAMVYVFLREPGERMPLAVQHFSAGELPKRVTFLGDSPAGRVELVARLSLRGAVERSEGDIEVVRALDMLGHPPARVEVAFDGAKGPQWPENAPETAPPPFVVKVRVTADGVVFPADGAVFVVARASGTRMPLAVKKLVFADLPADFVLTDDDAMTYSNPLSSAPRIALHARLSRSGSAARTDGDLESAFVEVDVHALPDLVHLEIDGSG
jgi:hypothetical protein